MYPFEMCCPNPSAISTTPMSSRNERARIFTVGCRSTKSPMAPADTSITTTLRTIAVIITQSWLAIPTAVITESSEKTMSRTRICASTVPAAAGAALFDESCDSFPSSLACISCAAFATRNRPPPMRIRSRPENSFPDTVKRGAVSCISHDSVKSRPIRIPSARAMPVRRIRSRFPAVTRATRMAMKTMLSTPRTISIPVSVSRAIQGKESAVAGMEVSSLQGHEMQIGPSSNSGRWLLDWSHMAGIEFIEHQGKRVLLLDFTAVKDTQVALRLIEQARALVAAQPQRKDLLTVTDVKGMIYNDEINQALLVLGKHNTPWVRASAICNPSTLGKVITRANNLSTGRSFRVFDSRAEALDWVVAQADQTPVGR